MVLADVARIAAAGLRALSTLSLSECPLLMDDVPAELALLVFSLTSLDLSYNQRLGDRGVKELAALVNLRQVRACGGWGQHPLCKTMAMRRLGKWTA